MPETTRKVTDRCPACDCCDIGPYNPGGYCCGAYVSGGTCHTVEDVEFGSAPANMDEWSERSKIIKARRGAGRR